MNPKLLLSVVFVFVMAFSAAADFTLVRTIPGPGVESAGLADADGVLFKVMGYGTGESCLLRVDPADGDVLEAICLTQEPPGCPGMLSNYVSCAFKPWNAMTQEGEDPLCMDTYYVGEECGDIVKYNWTDTYGLVYQGHCKPEGMGEPAGMTVLGDYVYVLDATERCIYKLNVCFEAPYHLCYLPNLITTPSALAAYGGNFFVGDAATGLVYELDTECGMVEIHSLEGFAPRYLSSMTFMGEYLFAGSDGDDILVYEFSSGGFEVPEGDSVVIEVLPDELEVTFPTVVDSGSLYVHVAEVDSCPPPEGVRLLPSYYELTTTASFAYIVQVAIMAEDPMPEDVNPNRVRIFRRPSGDCMPYMDVTVAPFEILEDERNPTLARLSKRLSEDDEFSVFILGEDNRYPLDVIELKYMYLEEAIDAVGGLPVDPVDHMYELLAKARAATEARRYGRAARFVDRIADVAMATPEIPHIFDPDEPGTNLGGRIVARAHTLSFSLRQLIQEQLLVGPLTMRMLGSSLTTGRVEISPNPSTSGFNISFTPDGKGAVSLRIYSVDGRLVRTLLERGEPEGGLSVTWDGNNSAGLRVAAGTYFAVMTQGESVYVRKLILR
jgi:hypothetical protein